MEVESKAKSAAEKEAQLKIDSENIAIEQVDREGLGGTKEAGSNCRDWVR